MGSLRESTSSRENPTTQLGPEDANDDVPINRRQVDKLPADIQCRKNAQETHLSIEDMHKNMNTVLTGNFKRQPFLTFEASENVECSERAVSPMLNGWLPRGGRRWLNKPFWKTTSDTICLQRIY